MTYGAEINAAHPAQCDNPDYATWELAEKLVHERHDKYDFVALVNWLLLEKQKAWVDGVKEGESPAG